jgi:diguanylate cyclase (GGDEF)-like protein/PAS domain S-box-containing protein
LDGVLAVVRRLGASRLLSETLEIVLDGIIGVVGFEAAAVNITTPEGDLCVEAVGGPTGVDQLLDTRRPMSFWTQLLDSAEPWGELRFVSHEADQTLIDAFATWTPDRSPGLEPDAWHPDDSLHAPMWGPDGRLIGVISVDEPRDHRRPSHERCTVLEVLASQAARAILDSRTATLDSAARREVFDRWRIPFEHSPTGMALVSPDRSIRVINSSLLEMLEALEPRLVGSNWLDLIHPEDARSATEQFTDLIEGRCNGYQGELRMLRADGTSIWAALHVAAIRYDGTQTIVLQVVDVTERRLGADRLLWQRSHDPLTRVANRTGVAEVITSMLQACKPVGVLYCDVDGFMSINGGLGRAAGDDLVAQLAGRLVSSVPASCTVGRVSGDEFAVVIPEAVRSSELNQLGTTIVEALARPLLVSGLALRVGMTIGSALGTPLHRHGDELLREAELSLTAAKRHCRGGVQVYDPGTLRVATRDDLELEQDLRAAVDDGAGLTCYLQPIVDLDTGDVIGAESLARWHHATRGTVLPDVFVPMAEQSGLIVPLGAHVLELGILAAARARATEFGWIAVNVSGSQLGRGRFPGVVRDTLERHGVRPSELHLEITETALAQASARAIDEVHEIAATGVSIALDDFGTGYSSLSLLRELPISVVKIDKSFITPIADDRRAAALVRSLVMMCASLDIRTVAEGVETPAQRAVVHALGCDHAQGYLFGRPLPPR